MDSEKSESKSNGIFFKLLLRNAPSTKKDIETVIQEIMGNFYKGYWKN